MRSSPLLAHRWLPLAAGLLLIAGFASLASEVLEVETQALDDRVLLLAQQWRADHPLVEHVMRDFSGVGSTAVLTLLTIVAVGYLAIIGHRARAAVTGLAMASGALAVTALKTGLGRARPDPSFAAFVQDGLSFPSGHASMSAVFFLTVGSLLAQRHEALRVRAYMLGVAVLLAGLVGLSRVALGVHWASDVLGGWMFGAGWALLWFWVAQRLHDTSTP